MVLIALVIGVGVAAVQPSAAWAQEPAAGSRAEVGAGIVGGDAITCSVTITNDFTYNAATHDQPTGRAAVVTTVECTGSAAGSSARPTGGTTVSTTPVASVDQCNGSGLGGASTVTCTVRSPTT